MNAVVSGRGLNKAYANKTVLKNINLDIKGGKIIGLIGPNGAGKTTLLKSLLGLTTVSGEINVLGFNPINERAAMLEDVCFIADTAILPRWIKVTQLLDYMAGVHPKFNREKACKYLKQTNIAHTSRVKELSKGMVTQLHLALIMAIDSKLLILDEPTLGLDIIYRKKFYDALLNDYYEEEKTIIITTHQVEEIENVITDVMFINKGEIILNETLENIAKTFSQVDVVNENETLKEQYRPISIKKTIAGKSMLFEGVDKQVLTAMGQVKIPTLADIFVAKIEQAGGYGNE